MIRNVSLIELRIPKPNWDNRFSDSSYAYGTEPNAFLAENADLLSGPVLSVAEGEGRNAVFLASRGLNVHAVDISVVGLSKANQLAEKQKVTITTEVGDLDDYTPSKDTFGSIISTFAHLQRLKQS